MHASQVQVVFLGLFERLQDLVVPLIDFEACSIPLKIYVSPAGARASCWTVAYIQDTLASTRCHTLISLILMKSTSCSSRTSTWTTVLQCHT